MVSASLAGSSRKLGSFGLVMNPSTMLTLVWVSCCLVSSACAPIPGRVPVNLRGPQHRDAFVDAPSSDGHGAMIVWKQPDFVKQNSPRFSSEQEYIDYSIAQCGGPIGKLFGEWKEVEPAAKTDPPMQLLYGRAAASEFSGADYWGTHRYRDWNILLAVGHDFERFLAPADFLDLGWDDDPIAQDLRVTNPNLISLFELEWDSGFFSPEMAPEPGDETLAIGRWVFDCGHEGAAKSGAARITGFRTEIHAPAILVSAHILERKPSLIRTRFKIFVGSRGGPLDATPLLVFERFWSSHQNPLGGRNYVVNLRAPEDGWEVSSCVAQDGAEPGGRRKMISKEMQTTDGGRSLTLTLSAKDFRPSARIQSSTILDIGWVPGNTSPSGGVALCK
jgi:hypothetical protein